MEAGQIVERLSRFDGPPEQFILALLALQCQLAEAVGGALLRLTGEGQAQVLATYPPLQPDANPPVWLARAMAAASGVASSGRASAVPLHEADTLYGQPARRHLILVPIRRPGQTSGAGAFVVETSDAAQLAERTRRLELSGALLQLYELRVNLQRREADFSRLRQAVEVLNAVNRHRRFLPAAMALCNEMRSRWQASRVSLGLPKGRYVRARAMSETEKFDRKTEDVQRVEAAMEECYDQDLEVAWPSPPEAPTIARAARELATRGSQASVISLPLRREGKVVGVVTAERPVEQPFGDDDLLVMRLACELCTARLIELSQTDRWIGARAAAGIRRGAAVAVGPKHTWLKLLAIAVAGFVGFALFAQGADNAEGTFVLQAARHQVVAAPYAERLMEVHVEPGDRVEKGQLLAQLRRDKIDAQLAQVQADYAIKMNEYSANLDANEHSKAEAALQEARKAQAQAKMLETMLAESAVVAPVAGQVLEGDWKRFSAPPVKENQQLFVIAPEQRFEAELLIPEDEIIGVEAGSRGELAATGQPDLRIGFTVLWVSPIAEPVGQKNVYRVRARLDRQVDWLRHGIEGVAKVRVGQASYARLWTRPVVNWVRMKLWW